MAHLHSQGLKNFSETKDEHRTKLFRLPDFCPGKVQRKFVPVLLVPPTPVPERAHGTAEVRDMSGRVSQRDPVCLESDLEFFT